MQSLTNQARIRRGRAIAKWLGLAGLGILLSGLVVSFNPARIQWSLPALVAGIILSQIGVYHANKYVRRPRADEVLDAGLKGLGKHYRFYHFLLPAEHVLVCPQGVLVFRPKSTDGRVTYDGRWRQNFSLLRLFQGLARDRLGNPTAELELEMRKVQDALARGGLEPDAVPVHGFVVFTSPALEMDLRREPPHPTFPVKRFKEGFRRWLKQQTAMPSETRREVQRTLDEWAGADEGS